MSVGVVKVLEVQTVTVPAAAAQTISLGVMGPQGPIGATGAQGPQGVQGLPGAATGSYQHIQAVASAVWTITHSLGFEPNIVAFDSTHRQVLGERADPDTNTTVLTFSGAVSGRATAS